MRRASLKIRIQSLTTVKIHKHPLAVENRFVLVRRDFGMGEYIQTVTVEGVFCHQTSSTMDDFKERERERE